MWLGALTVLGAVTMGESLEHTTKNDGISQAEAEWFQALRAADADAMSNLLADGFVGVTDIGTLYSKQEWIAQYSHEWSRSLRSFSVRNQQVRHHSNIAVVTGEMRYARPRGVYATVYTHVWRGVASKPQMILSQESPIIPPAMK
jgi:ketosteroid isomerase-like protein